MRHILVIRLSAMGDVAMTVPVINAFTRQYPDIKVSVLTRPFFKPLFAGLKNVDVIEVDLKDAHEGIGGLWKLYRSLSKMGFDAVADLHNVLRTKILKAYFTVENMTFVQIDKGRKEKKDLIRAEDKKLIPLKSTHERYADVFRKLGFKIELKGPLKMPKLTLNGTLKNELLAEYKKLIGIAPFAAYKGKMYPLNLMEEVIASLDARNDCQILLFGGGKKETTQLGQLAERYQNTRSVAGQFSFEDELCMISNLDLMLSMDSGNGHLSAVYGIPTITIWGVTHPYAGFAPFGQDSENWLLADRGQYPLIPTSVFGNKFPDGYEKAMETIRPEQILGKIDSILASV